MKRYLYALAIAAQRLHGTETTTEFVAGATWAVSADEARGAGIAEAQQRWPFAAGWGQHRVDILAVTTPHGWPVVALDTAPE